MTKWIASFSISPLTLFSLVAILTAPTLASANPGHDFAKYMAEVDRAIEADDAQRFTELACAPDVFSMQAEYISHHLKDFEAFSIRSVAYWHRRYASALTPPSNVHSLFPGSPIVWEHWGLPDGSFGGTRSGGGRAELWGGEEPAVPWLVLEGNPRERMTIDLDGDGACEVTLDGSDPHFADHLEVVREASSDGLLTQWLAGSKGSDPRTAPEIWIVRNGTQCSVILDPGADGKDTCGRSFCLAKE